MRDGGLLWPMTRREAGGRLGAMVGANYSGPLAPNLGGRHQVRSMHALDVRGERSAPRHQLGALSLSRGTPAVEVGISLFPHHVAAQLRIRMTRG